MYKLFRRPLCWKVYLYVHCCNFSPISNYSRNNLQDGKSWKLPLPYDEELQPLYEGPPLPLCALEAAGVSDYANASPRDMAKACRLAAGWKLASNGIKVCESCGFYALVSIFSWNSM